MRKNHILLLSILLLMACTGTKQSKEPAVDILPDKVVIAYVTSWSDIMPDPTYLTHINYAFGHVNDSFDGVRIDNEDRLRQLVALKKDAPHLQILLSIGGWGSGRFSEMAENTDFRERFAKDCQRVVNAFDLDGIDIDWEYPTADYAKISASPKDTENYTLLMRDIRKAIGDQKLLTQATVATAEYIDFKAVEPYMSFTNVMSYDMGNPPYLNSGLYRSEHVDKICTDEAIRAHLNAGIPPHKLVMGLPFYGRGIKDFPRPDDLTKVHLMEGYTAQWDDVAKVPYLTDADGNLVYGYENLESLAIKCEYALEHGLLGAMYWSYSGDNEAGDLRRTVYETLNKK